MGSQTDKKTTPNITTKLEKEHVETSDHTSKNLEEIIDENLVTLKKVHSILLNCINLTKKQKLEFAESERYFMKMYLKKLTDKINSK